MNHNASGGVFTEVNEGNEEFAVTSFPSLPSVTNRGIAVSCRSGAPGSEISNQPLQATAAPACN